MLAVHRLVNICRFACNPRTFTLADVPSCEGFFCKRGTNCYIRNGSPICLPNTCEVRECKYGLTCIDTPDGALCRRGKGKFDVHIPECV